MGVGMAAAQSATSVQQQIGDTFMWHGELVSYDQGAQTLSGTAELHHVGAEVVGLDDAIGRVPLIALSRQLSHRHTLLHIRVVTFQRLELQRVEGKRLDQLAETLVGLAAKEDIAKLIDRHIA